MIFHSTLYDGAWERAAVEALTPIFSISADTSCAKLAVKTVKNILLDDWKQGQGRSPEFGVKFVADPPSLPENIQVPEMNLCKIIDEGSLSIPSDVRQRWLRDPLRSKEWRDILAKFDQAHVPRAAAGTGESSGTGAAGSGEAGQAPPGQADFWAGVYPESTRSLEELEKGNVAATFPLANTSLVCKVVEGPEFFLCGTTSAGTIDTSEALFTHGGGTWILESKAAKALEDIRVGHSCGSCLLVLCCLAFVLGISFDAGDAQQGLLV